MKEVAAKMQGLYDEMVAKNAELEHATTMLKVSQKEVAELVEEQKNRTAELDKREKAVAAIEDAVELNDKAEAIMRNAQKEMTAVLEAKANLNTQIAQFEAVTKDAKATIEKEWLAIKDELAKLAEEKAKVEEMKKNYKADALKELTRGK